MSLAMQQGPSPYLSRSSWSSSSQARGYSRLVVIAPAARKPWLPDHEARMLRACRVELVEKKATAGMRMLVQVRLQMRLLLRDATQGVILILLDTRRKAGLLP